MEWRWVMYFGSFYDGKVKYMVNDLLMNLRTGSSLYSTINKTGKTGQGLSEMAGFASDDQLIMFPAGAAHASPEWGYPRFGLEKDVYSKERLKRTAMKYPFIFDGRNSDFSITWRIFFSKRWVSSLI